MLNTLFKFKWFEYIYRGDWSVFFLSLSLSPSLFRISIWMIPKSISSSLESLGWVKVRIETALFVAQIYTLEKARRLSDLAVIVLLLGFDTTTEKMKFQVVNFKYWIINKIWFYLAVNFEWQMILLSVFGLFLLASVTFAKPITVIQGKQGGNYTVPHFFQEILPLI